MSSDLIAWVCHDCGAIHGYIIPRICAWNYGRCDICKIDGVVTNSGRYGIYFYPNKTKFSDKNNHPV